MRRALILPIATLFWLFACVIGTAPLPDANSRTRPGADEDAQGSDEPESPTHEDGAGGLGAIYRVLFLVDASVVNKPALP